MKRRESLETVDLQRLQLFLALVPVFGFFPALWSLYRRGGSREEKQVSRLAIQLAIAWIFGYVLLGAGAQSTESLSLPLLLTSSLMTSGYFLLNMWLMVRVWQRKSLKLPFLGRVGEPKQAAVRGGRRS